MGELVARAPEEFVPVTLNRRLTRESHLKHNARERRIRVFWTWEVELSGIGHSTPIMTQFRPANGRAVSPSSPGTARSGTGCNARGAWPSPRHDWLGFSVVNLTRLQASLDVAARSLAPTFSVAFEAPLQPGNLSPPLGACFQALRRLPVRDFHTLD